jgi:hypothetical protein
MSVDEATRQAVRDVLRDRDVDASYRSFLFPGTIAEQQANDEAAARRHEEAGLQAPLTAFDSPSKGRAGLSETSPLGDLKMLWVSDDCYQTTGTNNPFVLDIAKGLYAAPTTFCLHPTRDDLFISAKPSYLMHAQERAATEKHLQRIERLRRPTTGVAMPLSE